MTLFFKAESYGSQAGIKLSTNWRWPWTPDGPDFSSQGLGSQVCITTPRASLIFNNFLGKKIIACQCITIYLSNYPEWVLCWLLLQNCLIKMIKRYSTKSTLISWAWWYMPAYALVLEMWKSGVQSHPWLHRKFKTRLRHRRPCLKKHEVCKETVYKLWMVLYTCNLSTWEDDAGRVPWVWSQHGLQNEPLSQNTKRRRYGWQQITRHGILTGATAVETYVAFHWWRTLAW